MKTIVSFTIDTDTYAEFADAVDGEGKKKSHVIQEFMERYIANKTRIKKQVKRALKDLSEGE